MAGHELLLPEEESIFYKSVAFNFTNVYLEEVSISGLKRGRNKVGEEAITVLSWGSFIRQK